MFQRIANLLKAFVNLFITGLERKNPEALLELEKENLRKNIVKYNEGLAMHAGMAEKLMATVKKQENEQQELKTRIMANVQAGNQALAGQYALKLKTLEQQLEENRKQMTIAEQTYRNLITSRDQAINAAKAKIEAIKTSLDNVKMQKAMAEMHEMASGVTSSIGSSTDTLNRLHEMVEEERYKAAGKARLAQDTLQDSMAFEGIQVQQAEQDALANAALSEFLNKEGQNANHSLEYQNSKPIAGEVLSKERVQR